MTRWRMRTDGDWFVRRPAPAASHGYRPWHYLVTDPTEPGDAKLTACGMRVSYPDLWETAAYTEIAGEHTGQDYEGVTPCCRRCLRVQRAEWGKDGVWT